MSMSILIAGEIEVPVVLAVGSLWSTGSNKQQGWLNLVILEKFLERTGTDYTGLQHNRVNKSPFKIIQHYIKQV